MKRELLKKEKLSIFKTVFVPILTYGHKCWVTTKRVRLPVQTSEMRFYKESKELHCLTRCEALRFENLLTPSRCFSKLKDVSLVGLAMYAVCLKKCSPNKLYLPKQMGEDQLDDLELNGPITLRILDGIA